MTTVPNKNLLNTLSKRKGESNWQELLITISYTERINNT